MEIIDIHAHLQFRQFDEDREEVIGRTLEGAGEHRGLTFVL